MEERYKVCPACQTHNPEAAKRCMECGQNIESEPVKIILEVSVLETEPQQTGPLRPIQAEEATDQEIERIATLTATNPSNWIREEHGFRYQGGFLDVIRVPQRTRFRLGNKTYEPGRRVRANNGLLTFNPSERRQR